MSNKKSTKDVIVNSFNTDGFFWLALVFFLIACMHYGYTCSACGCSLENPGNDSADTSTPIKG